MSKESLAGVSSSVHGQSGTDTVGSVVMGATTAEAPLTPEQKLKNLMTYESWMVTQSYVQWGQVWENTRQGIITPYNEDSRMVMLAPFTFFNAPPGVIQVMFARIVPYFMAQYGQYMTDELFAKTNPMPWLVLQSFAPQFAMQDRGHDASLLAWQLIKELRELGQLPLQERGEPAKPGTPEPGGKQPTGQRSS